VIFHLGDMVYELIARWQTKTRRLPYRLIFYGKFNLLT
jgi:hypothetical protein